MYKFYIRCLISIRKAFYLYRISISRISAIKSFSEMFAFAFAFSFFFVYFHSHHRASKIFWASKVFFQKCSLSLSHFLLYILIRIIEHRKSFREFCHSKDLNLSLIQNDRIYFITTCTQQKRVFVMNENEKRRRKHQLSIDVFSSKRRTWSFRI